MGPGVGEGTEGNIMIDSGSVIHVFSPAFGQCSGHALRKDRNLQIHGAGGHNIKHHGQQQIDFVTGGQKVSVDIEIADVTRPILSVLKLVRRGYCVHFGPGGSLLSNDEGDRIPIEIEDEAFVLQAQLTEHGPWAQAAAMPVLAEQQAGPEDQNGRQGPEEEEGSEDMGTGPIPRAAGAGAEAPVPKPLPQAPTAEEKAQHELTHLPYRPWCSVCVQAKARDDPHRKQTNQDSRWKRYRWSKWITPSPEQMKAPQISSRY